MLAFSTVSDTSFDTFPKQMPSNYCQIDLKTSQLFISKEVQRALLGEMQFSTGSYISHLDHCMIMITDDAS